MLTTALDQFDRIDTSSAVVLRENEPTKAWLEKVGYAPWLTEPQDLPPFADVTDPDAQLHMSGFISTIQTAIGKQYPELPIDQIEHVA